MKPLAPVALCWLTLATSPAWAGAFFPAQDGSGIPGRWMVTLDVSTPKLVTAQLAQRLVGTNGAVERVWSHALGGFVVVSMPHAAAERLSRTPGVAGVYQDRTLDLSWSAPLPECGAGTTALPDVTGTPNPQSIVCDDPDPQNANATCEDNWGLDRLDGTTATRNGSYAPPATGQGVHIFFVDTGLYGQHQDFQGRVGLSYSGVTNTTTATPEDCEAWSHGTHVAAIAAGKRFGVAKNATVHVARVFDCFSGVQVSSMVSAFDWIAQAHTTLVPGPAVASWSMNGGPPNIPDFVDPQQPLGLAIAGTLAAGVLVVESAGNQAGDACEHSARTPGMLLVGGSDKLDTVWERVPGDPYYSEWCGGQQDCGSNTGPCVDVFAPAAHIVSAWLGAPANVANVCRLSGTSMAAPHAAGVAALYLEQHPSATPAQVKQALLDRAQPVITQLPANTTNRLLTVLDAPQGGLVFTPSPADLGAALVGVTSSPVQLTANNNGLAAVALGVVALEGTHAADFVVQADGCSSRSVAPAGSCVVTIALRPSAAGVRTANLALPTDGPMGVVRVALSGVGQQPNVVVTRVGTGTGTITSAPLGIACGTTCQGAFSVGTNVTLTQAPMAGSLFSGWMGVAGCGVGPDCSFQVPAVGVVDVQARFDAVMPPRDGGPALDAAAARDGSGNADAAVRRDGGARADSGDDAGVDGGAAQGDASTTGGTQEPPEKDGCTGCNAGRTGGALWFWVAAVVLAWRGRRSRAS